MVKTTLIFRNVIVVSLTIIFITPFLSSANAEKNGSVCAGADLLNAEATISSPIVDVYTGPGTTFKKLVNKAASTPERTVYRQIYGPEKVLVICSKGEWSYVKIGEPFPFEGWVSSRQISGIQIDSAGQRVYSTKDFPWDDERALPYKEIIVAGVNKIVRENNRCVKVEGASISVTKSKPGKPVFYVSCLNSEGRPFNEFFDEADTKKPKGSLERKPIKKELAALACKQHALSNATHPSTVSFSILGYRDHPNGRTTVLGEFSAKNAFNLKITYNIRCLFDSDSLMEAQVVEKAD